MLKELIVNQKSPWTGAGGEQKEIVLCSRIRLARNFSKYPFPLKQTEESGQYVLSDMAAFCQNSSYLKFYDLQDIQPRDKQVLVEKHLISPEHAKDDHHCRGLAVNEDGSISIMVNEEDHLRIQCFAPGLNLQDLWERANRLDDEIESKYDYAFDEKLGYLTCCPTNLGNGMRASVMIHLPGLSLTKRLSLLDQLSNFGMTVRGLFGEGSQSIGDLYQISNQVTIGQTEKDILINLNSVTQQIIKEEMASRKYLQEHNGLQLEDRIWRAYGTLSHARYLSSKEALELISLVRLGHSLGYFTQLDLDQLNMLYLIVQPAYLQALNDKESILEEVPRDHFRAEKIREVLQK